MAGPIRISILANAGSAVASIKTVDNSLGRLNTRFSRLKAPAIALGAAVVGLGGGLLALAKGAAEDEKAQTVLARTIKNTTGATDAQVSAIEAYISKVGVATGVTDDEMRPAFANIVRATKDVGKAQSLTNLAMDVSAGTGKELSAVSAALAKAYNGNAGALGKMGIKTKDASGKALKFDQIVQQLTKTFGGQAAAAAGTLQGKWERLRLIAAETGESIGGFVLPILTRFATFLLTRVGPALTQAGTFFRTRILPPLQTFGTFIAGTVIPAVVSLARSLGGNILTAAADLAATFGPLAKEVAALAVTGFAKLRSGLSGTGGILSSIGQNLVRFTGFLRDNGAIVRTVAVGIGAMVIAFQAYKATLAVISIATKAFAAVQAVLNVVLSANPIGVIVLAVIGLAAGLIYAYKHSARFRDVVDGLWGSVQRVAGAISGAFMTAVHGIGTAISAVVDFIGSRWKLLPLLLLGPIGLVLFVFKGLPGKIVSALGNLAGTLYNAGRSLILGLIRGYNAVIKTVASFFTGLARTVARWVGNVASTLYNAGRTLLVGFARGYASYVRTVASFFTGVARSVLRWVGDTGRTLYARGRAFLVGMVSGVVSYLSAVASRFTTMSGNVLRWVGNTAATLYNAGRGLIVGLARGIASYMQAVANIINGIRGGAIRWLGNVGSILYNAGRNIIGGLINGINSMIGALRSKLSSITNLIPGWKGPPPRDKKLLTPAGKSIMDGLIAGIDARLPLLARTLTGVSSMIESGVSASPSVSLSGSAGGLLLASGGTAPVQINVYALTAGPEVGRQVVQALKDYEAINGARWRA